MNKITNKPSVDKPWLKWYPTEVKNASVPSMNCYDYMYAKNIGNFSSSAINYFGRKISYKELIDHIEVSATSFEKMGVKKGDIVTFCMPTLPETIYSFYALNKLGAVAAFIDPTTNTQRIEDFINLFESKLLVAIDLFAPRLESIVKNTKVENTIIVSATDSLPPIMNLGYKAKKLLTDIKGETSKIELPKNIVCTKWQELENLGKSRDSKRSMYNENIPAAIVLTSGTTGSPKGALLSNENLNSIAIAQGYCTNMQRKDTFLNIMPPFIAYGLVCGISNVLGNGLEMIIVPKFEKRTKAEYNKELNGQTKKVSKFDGSSTLDTLLVKHKPNHVLGVPNFYLKLMESPKMKEHNFKYIKSIIAGGDVFHSTLEEMVNAFLMAHQAEYNINKGYGMTELTTVATYTNTPDTNKLGSVGIPIMFNNVKIIDVNTKEELGYNEVGELYMSGPGVILGYLGNDKESKKTFITDENGVRWVKTGDLFTIDEDGVLYFKGRIKRMIVRPDGHNVFPCNIEEILSSSIRVRDCAVVGIKASNGMGEIPTACVTINDGFDENETEVFLRKLLIENLPERDVALDYKFLEKIPYTTFGKVDYITLKEMYEQKPKQLIKK